MNYEDFDTLKEYLKTTIFFEINPNLKIRLAQNMVENFKNGFYATEIEAFSKIMEEVGKLGIKYPNDASPCLYIYLVPNENFAKYLNFPKALEHWGGGGKVVPAFEEDGFPSAYGASENTFYKKPEPNIMEFLNHAHEIGHIVHNMFWSKDEFICEGFAEALVLYTLGYEEMYEPHLEALANLNENQIFSVKELMEISKDDKFQMATIIPNASCSFEPSYISSYLFVRGCLEHIESSQELNKIEATQRFLEIVKETDEYGENLVSHIAESIGLPYEDLLRGKSLQMKMLNKIKDMFNKKKEGQL